MERKTGEQMYKEMSLFLNSYSSDISGYVVAAKNDHRTLQQSHGRLIFAMIQAWAKMYEEKNYDGRNEDICRVCHKIISEFGERDLYLPFI